MCDPISLAVVSGISTAAGVVANNKAVNAQVRAINHQNAIRAEEISQAAGQQLSENAKAAYRERAAMRAAAAESGINLGSGSFLAALQASTTTQYNEAGLIIHNERAQQRARQAQADSAVAGLQKDTFLSGAVKVAGSAASTFTAAGGTPDDLKDMVNEWRVGRVMAGAKRQPASLTIPVPGRVA